MIIDDDPYLLRLFLLLRVPPSVWPLVSQLRQFEVPHPIEQESVVEVGQPFPFRIISLRVPVVIRRSDGNTWRGLQLLMRREKGTLVGFAPHESIITLADG